MNLITDWEKTQELNIPKKLDERCEVGQKVFWHSGLGSVPKTCYGIVIRWKNGIYADVKPDSGKCKLREFEF